MNETKLTKEEHENIIRDVTNAIMARLTKGLFSLIFVIITLAAGGFSAWTSIKSDVAVMRSMLEIIKEGQTDRYYGTQAKRDLNFIQNQIDRISDELHRHTEKNWHETAGLKLQELQDMIEYSVKNYSLLPLEKDTKESE